MNRAQKILLAAIAGLAIVAIVCTIVVVKVVTDSQRQAQYTACLESYGFTPGDVTTEDELAELAEASELCSS